ncbi:MAG: B12-binding domain-containing radical SAM protein [Candidatus Aegiribacteria sp.]|nr:B12-binding domain-containing radical SAM protein [Candidatus Aegiribacteria sp.]
MRITAVNPPFIPGYSRGQRSPAVTKSGTLYYPIWLAYAVGALENAGHEVDLVDAPADGMDIEQTAARITAFDPGLVIVETSTPSIESDVRFADSIAITGRFVVMVGTHPSALPDDTLSMGKRFSGIVAGEYENPLTGLAEAIENGKEPKSVKGLYLRQVNGEAVFTGDGERVSDLDSLPYVSRIYSKHLDIYRYSNPNALYPQVMIMGGRGCPHACTFCVFPSTLQGRKLRTRSVKNITGEMLWVQNNMPEVRAVFFEDDTISIDREHLRELGESFIGNGVSVSWTSNMRADVDLETLRLCRKAGLRTVCVGFESGSNRMLTNMRKGITVEMSLKFAENARKAGILIHGCFMVGTQGEDRETMRETLELALKINPDTAQFYPMMVYPGTEAYMQACESNNLVAENWRDWLTEEGLHSCVISTEDLSSAELVDFCDYARRRFYLRPLYIIRKLLRSILDGDERIRTFRAFSTFRKYLFRNSRRR